MKETPDTKFDHERSYFRIRCEFQVRYRIIEDEELKVFQSYALRPSAHSSLRNEVESQLQAMPIREESKVLLERAFQILLNIDQRLELIEEQLENRVNGGTIVENYEWVHANLGAGGVAFRAEKVKDARVGQTLLLDMLLPSMPEYRIVAAAKILGVESDGSVRTEFVAIHAEDREYIHRFVIAREREILRDRAKERNQKKD